MDGEVKSFRTDITETKNAYLVEAELPGFAKEDITIDVNSNQLTIRAKREQLEETKDKYDKIIRKERHYGEFLRQFYVDNIKEDDIKAKLEDGVLKIEIPKNISQESKGKQIEIK